MKKLCLFLCLILGPVYTYAWNIRGHEIIAAIAYQHLTPQTKDAVNKILQGDQNGNKFDYDAGWADEIKAQGITQYNNWHFIDTPYTKILGEKMPPIPKENVVWAIHQHEKILSNTNSTTEEKKQALKFLIHFVGDAHQPLHCITQVSPALPYGDQGGNLYPIKTKKYSNLHALWDDAFGFNSQRKSIKHLASKLEEKFPESFFGTQLNDTNPQNWANESYQLAIADAYDTPKNKKTSRTYMMKGRKVAEEQMALAGYRLAKVLNEVFS